MCAKIKRDLNGKSKNNFDIKSLAENNIDFFDILFLFCYAYLKQRKFEKQNNQGDNYDTYYTA